MSEEQGAVPAGGAAEAGAAAVEAGGAQAAATAQAKAAGTGRRKRQIGRVVSDKMNKTVVVTVERTVRHPVFGKVILRSKKYKAHDEDNAAKVGDRVELEETRPLSRDKRWRVVRILERAR